MAHRAPSTLAEAVGRAIVRAIVATVTLGAALVIAPHLVTSTRVDVRPPSTPSARPTADGSPAAALAEAAERDLVCWTSAAPRRFADDIPTHVVWQRPSGRAIVSARLVGPALETLFGDGHLSGRAIAFCHTDR